MSRRKSLVAATTCAALLAIGSPSSGAPTELTVGAAASLRDALTQVGQSFATSEKSVKVSFNFAASSTVVQQIISGAALDVFVSADQASMDKVADLLAAGSRQDILAGELVLIVPINQATSKITNLAALTGKDIKSIAVCDAAVPAGHYARVWLKQRQILDAVAPRIVKPENVRAALALVASGVADAGFVYATDALLEAAKVRVVDRATTVDGIDVRYLAAALAKSKHLAAASRFVAYLRTAPARAIFVKFGFKPL